KEEGVNGSTNNYHPLNNNTNNYHPLNNNTNNYHPLNNNTNNYHPLNNNSTNYHPLNTNTYNQHPFNNNLTIVLNIRKPKISISKYVLREMGFILINQSINIKCKEIILNSVICMKNKFNLQVKDLEIFIFKNRIKEYIVNKIPIEITGSIVDTVIGCYDIGKGEGSVLEGVNDKGSVLEGVKDTGSMEGGVSDRGSKQQGVSDSSVLEGVNECTSKQEGFNYTTDVQDPVNNTTNQQHPFNNLPNQQHPFSNTTLSVLHLDSCIDKLRIKIPKDLLFIRSSNIKGVNNNTDNLHPVNNNTTYYHVNDNTDIQHPVNNNTYNQHPVNNNTYNQHPVNNNTDIQHPFSNNTYNQHPVNNNTYNQNPLNHNTTQHPLNNTRLTFNLSINNLILDLPFISYKLKGKEITLVSDLNVEIFTFNFNIKGNKLKGCYRRDKWTKNIFYNFNDFRFKGNEYVVKLKKEIEEMLMFIKGGRDNSVLGGVNDKSRIEGVNNKDRIEDVNDKDRIEDVNDKDTKQHPVNYTTDKQHPVNYTTHKQHPVNNTTDKQHPVNYTTDKQHPVNYTTDKQHPVNNTTDKQHPINNTLLFTNLRLNIITPLISILIKVKEIKNKNIKKILIKTNNTLLNISKISLINNTITNIRIIKDESTDKDIFYILQFLKELEIIPFTTKSSEEEVFIIRNVKIISYFSLSLYSKVIFKSKNIYILFKKDSLRIEIPISIGVNDSGLEGFSDSSRLEGVNDSGIEGVRDSSRLEGVNLSNYNYKGVNISTNKQHPFNTNNTTQHPYNTNNTTQHPFNTNNTTQHPFNTTINTLNVSLVILKDTNGLIITPVITGSIDNEFYRILTRNILEIIEITLNIIDCLLIKSKETTFNFNILPLVCVRLYCIIGNSVIELGVLDSSIEIKGVSGNRFIKEEGGVNDTGVDNDRGNGLEGVNDKDML
ncbi:hypothetical protein CWI39_1961p0010, partial [Hamiltosporidium magnivora]